MGKGDRRSKKGKVFAGSFGNSRNRKKIKARVKSTKTRAATAKRKTTTKKK